VASWAIALTILTLIVTKHSRAGGFTSLLQLTVLLNIYMWHLAYLYAPHYQIKVNLNNIEQNAEENQLAEEG